VEEANLHVQISQLRKVIGSEYVTTVLGRGYRFVGPVQATTQAHEAPPSRRLSVIVLPFIERHAPPDQAYFADALTDDITTQLSKIKGSFVIGTTTAFTYGRNVPDFTTVATELGVRYALQGRIHRESDEIEVNARLSDARTGAVIWSDSLTVPLGRVGQVRREVVARLAKALDLQLAHAEAAHAARVPNSSIEAVDLVMQARHAGGWNWSREHPWLVGEDVERLSIGRNRVLASTLGEMGVGHETEREHPALAHRALPGAERP